MGVLKQSEHKEEWIILLHLGAGSHWYCTGTWSTLPCDSYAISVWHDFQATNLNKPKSHCIAPNVVHAPLFKNTL